jgi:acetyl-CoA acetyltransferase
MRSRLTTKAAPPSDTGQQSSSFNGVAIERDAITSATVIGSRNCAPGCASACVRIRGAGQAHRHQHVTLAGDVARYGASDACERAIAASGVGLKDIDYVAIYDSFTITLAILLEEIGIAQRGEAALMAKAGEFGVKGRLPLNTHGGLLSYGHCGTGGAMAHVVETHLQMTGRAGPRQVPKASLALMHGDGGILSSHVSMFVERVR